MTVNIEKGVQLLTDFIEEVTETLQLLADNQVMMNDKLGQVEVKANMANSDIGSVESRLEFMIANVEKRIDTIVRRVAERLDVLELDIDS